MTHAAAFTIRHAEPEDYAAVIAVVDEWWGGRHMAEMLPKLFFIHFRPTSFVAEAEGRIVGFLAGFRSQTKPEQAYVHFVGIDPVLRGSGIARALYARFFAASRAMFCTEVRGVTSPENRASIAFHAAMGFELLPGDAVSVGIPFVTDYDGPGQSRVLLRKRIDAVPDASDAR
jgi:predicted GNAT superfamily acetyltransferase